MTYPFSAVVGLDDLKLALVLNAVSPSVGGVLVRGEKGTAKSTVVRALAALLPPVAVVADCRFACDPASPDPQCPDGPHAAEEPATIRPARLVELPVGASEDRVAGSLDLERALTEGVKAFEPGLLAAAHRGVLYVDEVNLLHDHLVDLLLDAAAMGTAYVEREGVSVRHAARFQLVGTMNPEEGELRPQLLDRFGLAVDVRATREPDQRAEVVRRRLSYENDPARFAQGYETQDAELADRIGGARERLPRVVLPDAALRQITAVCAAFDVDGLRADIVTARAAVALAAWCGRDEVTGDDVRTAARLALPHRRRRDPFDSPGVDEQQLDEALEQAAQQTVQQDPDDEGPPDPPPGGGRSEVPSENSDAPDSGTPNSEPSAGPPAAPDPAYRDVRARLLALPTVGFDGPAGRRGRTLGGRGRTVGARRPPERLRTLHLPATLTAAAPYQRSRGRVGTGLLLQASDLREAVQEGRESNLVLFCVDASGSMAARQRMRAVKGAVLSLLRDAYQRRDKVGLVTFRGADAEVTLPPTSSVELAVARLEKLPTGGRTPLAAGLMRSARVLRTEKLRDPRRRPLLIVVTDGRHTAGADPVRTAGALASIGAGVIVVDCESGPVRLGLASRLGAALGADVLTLDDLAADRLVDVVRDARRAA